MSNKICYDFLTFTSKIHSTTSIIQLLGLEDVTFETLKGFYGYRDRLYFDGISIHYKNLLKFQKKHLPSQEAV